MGANRAGVVLAVLMSVTALALGCGAGSSLAHDVVLPDFAAEEAAWSPDSSLIAAPGRGEIELRSAAGKPKGKIAIRNFHAGFPCECRLGWTSDSGRVLFLSHKGEIEGKAYVGSARVDGGGPQLAPLGVPIGAAGWSPGGWPLFYVPNARAFRVGVGPVGPTPDIWRLDRLGAKPRRILTQKGEENDLRVSPDGSQVLYSRSSERSTSLWMVGSDGSDPRRLSPDLIVVSASFSPDGSQIALAATTRNGDRRTHLYLIAAAGGPLREIFAEEILASPPAWTPDGEWITFSNWEGEIRRIHPDGTGIETIGERPGREVRGLQWSPDGANLAFDAVIHREPD
jgi:dipeptidyl aminopeptidase/acylaminoacyl peptidase